MPTADGALSHRQDGQVPPQAIDRVSSVNNSSGTSSSNNSSSNNSSSSSGNSREHS